MCQTRTFCLFSSFSKYNDNYSKQFDYKSVDGMLMIRTQDRMMVGADNSLRYGGHQLISF